MPFSLSQASLPVFELHLNALSAVLDKGEAHAAAKKIDPTVLLHSRLAPDMFDLTRQVQVSSDQARRAPRASPVPRRRATKTTKRRSPSSRRALPRLSPT